MAQSQRTLEELSAEDQALLDQMRADDAQSGSQPPVTETTTPATEAPAATPATEQPQQPPAPKMVPLAALHEERERRKESDRRLQTLEERTNLLLQRIGQPAAAPAAQQPAEPPKPEIPALDKDPVGHILGTQQELARQLQTNTQTTQQRQQQIDNQLQAMQVLSALTQRAKAVEAQFELENPDYGQAVNHLRRVRHQELQALGYDDPAERGNIIDQEGLGVAARSFQTGRNPAEAIYNLAKMRGWAPPAPAQSASAEPAEPASPTADQRLQNIAAGQQHARSLGNLGGRSPQPMDARRLAELPNDEFAKILETAEGMALLGA
jgi:hypothetical protein